MGYEVIDQSIAWNVILPILMNPNIADQYHKEVRKARFQVLQCHLTEMMVFMEIMTSCHQKELFIINLKQPIMKAYYSLNSLEMTDTMSNLQPKLEVKLAFYQMVFSTEPSTTIKEAKLWINMTTTKKLNQFRFQIKRL